MPASRNRPIEGLEPRKRKAFELANSTVTLEPGPAGTIARIDRADRTDYAGPLSDDTIQALEGASWP